jgi:hypothetical protein
MTMKIQLIFILATISAASAQQQGIIEFSWSLANNLKRIFQVAHARTRPNIANIGPALANARAIPCGWCRTAVCSVRHADRIPEVIFIFFSIFFKFKWGVYDSRDKGSLLINSVLIFTFFSTFTFKRDYRNLFDRFDSNDFSGIIKLIYEN